MFLLAGVAKLWDVPASQRAVAGFGAPLWLARPLGILLPIVELGTAGLLVPARSAVWGGVAALILLSTFMAVIALNLARGRAPDCRCFGQFAARPIGSATLVRNGVLALAAAAIVWTSSNERALSAAELLVLTNRPGLTALGILVLAVIGGQTWLLLYTLRKYGTVLLRLEALEQQLGSPLGVPALEPARPRELPVGARAPAFELRSISGASVRLETLWSDGKSALLIFTDPECEPCRRLLPQVARWQQDRAETMNIALVCAGEEHLIRRQAAAHGLANVLLEAGTEVTATYGAYGTPLGLLIRPGGFVASEPAAGVDEIAALLSAPTDGGAPGVVAGPPWEEALARE